MKTIRTTLLSAWGLVATAVALTPQALVEQAHHSLPVLQHSLPFVGKVASFYTSALHQHPLVTKMATGGVLATCGDAIAQSKTDEPYDTRRAGSFFTFDMAYRALQHVSFPVIVASCHGQFLSDVVPSDLNLPPEALAAMEQTLASQLGIVPFLYYPVFFTLTAYIQGLTAPQGLERAKENFLPLMKRNLLFWIPVQFIQFGYIPSDLQIPFLSVAGLCWTFILSVAAGSAKSYAAPSVAEQENNELAEQQACVSSSSYKFTKGKNGTVSA